MEEPKFEIVINNEGLNNVKSIAFSPDGNFMASGGMFTHNLPDLQLWNLKQEKESPGLVTIINENLIKNPARVNCVAISPNGLRMLSGSLNKFAKLWSRPSPESNFEFLQDLEHINQNIIYVAFLNDALLITATAKEVKFWSTFGAAQTNKNIPIGDHNINCITSSETMLVYTTRDTMYIHNNVSDENAISPATIIPFNILGFFINGLNCLAISPNNDYIWCGLTGFSSIKPFMIDVNENSNITLRETQPTFIKLDKEASCITFNSDGTLVAVGADTNVYIWKTSVAAKPKIRIVDLVDTQYSDIFSTGDATARVNSVAFSNDGNMVACGDSKGSIHIWSKVDIELLANPNDKPYAEEEEEETTAAVESAVEVPAAAAAEETTLAAAEASASAAVEAPAKDVPVETFEDSNKYGKVPPTFLASINTVKKNLKKYINNNKSTITIKSVFTNYNDSYNEENAIKDGEILAAIINNCDKSCENYYDSIKKIIANEVKDEKYLYTVVKTYNENLKDKVKDEYKIYQRIDFPKPPAKSALKKTGGRTRRKKQKKTKKQKKRKNTKKRKTQKKHKKNRKTRRKLKLK